MKAKHFRWVFIILILLIAVTFIKLPYYITQPGEASELRPLIKVDGGYPEKGSLSLMTVKVGPPIRIHIFGRKCILTKKSSLMKA